MKRSQTSSTSDKLKGMLANVSYLSITNKLVRGPPVFFGRGARAGLVDPMGRTFRAPRRAPASRAGSAVAAIIASIAAAIATGRQFLCQRRDIRPR